MRGGESVAIDSLVPGVQASAGDPASRSGMMRALNRRDVLFRWLTQTSAILVLAVLGAIFASLLIGSWLAFSTFGLGFFASQTWNPVTEKFGALAPIYGTVVTSLIAMLIAVPTGLGVAIFLTELCPPRLRQPIGIAIELLAGIPSIIYGIWGLFFLAPVLQQYVQPGLIGAASYVPVLNYLFQGPPYGIGMMTAGIVLAIMILPFISAVSRDVFATVPPMLKEAAYGLGCTTWEVIWNVTVPYTSVGLLGGVMLALGRALGETMAVTFVIGNAHRISASILAPATTISATIANEFTEATGDTYTSALIALGLILFIIAFIVLALARLMLARIERRSTK
jgi:phosphate transport system permease protein